MGNLNASVTHISTVHRLYDNRIFFKECLSLVNAGYETHYVVSNLKNTKINNVFIHTLPMQKGRFFRIFVKDFLALFKAVATKSEIFHIHDPELILHGWVLKKLLRKKVIFDVHEFIIQQIENKEWLKKLRLNKIIANLYLKFEKKILKIYDSLILVVPEMMNLYNFHDNTVVVRNLPILDTIKSAAVEKKIEKNWQKVVIYPGTLSHNRGITNLIKAFCYLPDNYELWLLGKWASTDYKIKCHSLKGWNKVKYFGQNTPEEVYNILKLADVGVQLVQPTNQYTKAGYPVKVFEYLAAGLPAIVSDLESKRKLFKDSVYYIDPTDPIKIARGIDAVIKNENLRNELVQKGKNFIKNYSWENEQKKLIILYNNLLLNKKSQR